MPVFGPAGNSQSFYEKGYKKTEQVPQYLAEMGLNAFEYQCGRGVRIGNEPATLLGELFSKANIAVSLHAPYYISLSGIDEQKRLKSLDYILQSAKTVKLMGGQRIVVHTGSASKISRAEAMNLAGDTIKRSLVLLEENGLDDVRICLETMGKVGQLGSLEEVLSLCRLDDRLLPCIDFGHLNARTQGGLSEYEDFKAVFDAIENLLGVDRLRVMHVHFSKIAYTKAGERAHLTFQDTEYGPQFEPMIELALKKGCDPVFICESAGTQAEDAITMLRTYEYLLKQHNYLT